MSIGDALILCGTNASMPVCRKYAAEETGLAVREDFYSPQLFAINRITSHNYLDAQQAPAFHYADAIYFINSGSYTIEPTINKQIVGETNFATLVKTPKGALKSKLLNPFLIMNILRIINVKNSRFFVTKFPVNVFDWNYNSF